MRAGEGRREAEGGDQHQGNDPPDHEDHGDHLALPETENMVKETLFYAI